VVAPFVFKTSSFIFISVFQGEWGSYF